MATKTSEAERIMARFDAVTKRLERIAEKIGAAKNEARKQNV
jgi:hypothetical protein